VSSPAFLGIERSIAGKRWIARLTDERAALAIAATHELADPLARVLAARGVALEHVPSFLAPSLRESLPDPSTFKDMDEAAERLACAIRGGELVAIFGDYDVDGATSAALLHRYIAAVGGRCRVYVPDRLAEGYGPNAKALRALAAEGAKVVVTVDCGITAFEALTEGRSAGLDIVVCDHHAAEPRLPPALVVNPNRVDERGAHRQLAAVGVAFLLAVALNRSLRRAGHFASDRKEPDLIGLLDLVALGTVADVVPLTGLNRIFVAQGLRVMARRGNAGLRALADVARLAEAPNAFHLGFLLGPRVNAGGRVGKSDLGARLLATDDPDEAMGLAIQLERYNAERRAIEAEVEAAALRGFDDNAPGAVAVAVGKGWHPGVIGIVASRLKERFDRPALVVAVDKEGTGKGSARSVRGVDFGATVIAARQAGLLVNGGGHPMAAGLTVEERNIPALAAFLEERIAPALALREAVPTLALDGAVSAKGASVELIEALDQAGPYGSGHPEPRFALPSVRVVRADVVGEKHTRVVLASDDGGRIKGIAFRAEENALGPALRGAGARRLHVAGALTLNSFRGEIDAQIRIEDAAFLDET
jgi:single-stranded-DNA-specific exonuclease